jgi:hypothetical protein
LKSKLAQLFRASLLVSLALSFAIASLGCRPTRDEIEAALWLNNFKHLPVELCISVPELNDYGFYRVLDNHELEFISICDPSSSNWLAMHETDLSELMKKYGIKKKK